MIAADHGNASIMNLRAANASLLEHGTKLWPVAFGLCHKNQAGRLEPRFDLIDSDGERSRRRINTRMGHDGKKLMSTRPRTRPR
jgi:hypothetical protein